MATKNPQTLRNMHIPADQPVCVYNDCTGEIGWAVRYGREALASHSRLSIFRTHAEARDADVATDVGAHVIRRCVGNNARTRDLDEWRPYTHPHDAMGTAADLARKFPRKSLPEQLAYQAAHIEPVHTGTNIDVIAIGDDRTVHGIRRDDKHIVSISRKQLDRAAEQDDVELAHAYQLIRATADRLWDNYEYDADTRYRISTDRRARGI